MPTTSLLSAEKHSYALSIPSGNALGRQAFRNSSYVPGSDPARRDPDDVLLGLHALTVSNRIAGRSEQAANSVQRGKEKGMKRGVLLFALGAAVVSAVAAAAFVGSVGPTSATASSHREAPLIADDPAADNTDVYAFVSPDKPNTVTIIANYYPVRGSGGWAELLPVRSDRPLRA